MPRAFSSADSLTLRVLPQHLRDEKTVETEGMKYFNVGWLWDPQRGGPAAATPTVPVSLRPSASRILRTADDRRVTHREDAVLPGAYGLAALVLLPVLR